MSLLEPQPPQQLSENVNNATEIRITPSRSERRRIHGAPSRELTLRSAHEPMENVAARAWVSAAIVAAMASAANADADAEAWDLLQRGTALYQQGDYTAARAALARARELVPEGVPVIDRWLGLADARLGHCSDAIGELGRYLTTSPSDADAVAEAVAARDGCKHELMTRGRLRVETSPPGAEVRFDADDPKAPLIGVSPLWLESAPIGEHLVSVHREGYRPASRIVSITPGQRALVQLTLVPLVVVPPSIVAVAAAPAPRRVWGRRWFWPVVTGAAVVVLAVGVGVGVGVGTSSRPTFPVLIFR